jgi:hypothetical protein
MRFLPYTLSLSVLLPVVALAASAPTDFKSLVAMLVDLIGMLVILTFALTFLAFIWGVVKGWIFHGAEAEGVESGKNVVIASIIAFVVMVSIWGILAMLKASLFE